MIKGCYYVLKFICVCPSIVKDECIGLYMVAVNILDKNIIMLLLVAD
jgi:hypothetical protein